jgi:hypothetical protein
MDFVKRLVAWLYPQAGSTTVSSPKDYRQSWKQTWRLSSAIAGQRRGYVDQLKEELKILESVATDPQKSIIQQVLNAPSTLTLADIFRLEAAVVSFLPASVLRRRAWIIRGMFADAAGERRKTLYDASNPPDPLTASEEELRADLSQLLSAVERVSLTSELEDHLRSRFRRRVRTTALVALAVLIVAMAASVIQMDPKWVPTIWIVLLAGIVGACFSSQQRLPSLTPEGDVQTRVQMLARLAESFYFAPVGGAIGALVLFCLFAANLVQGDLFPKIIMDSTVDAVRDNPHSFFAFLLSAGPEDGVQTAKLLVWSFIAGFSERLVPTALDQLSGRLAIRGSDKNNS